jgi:hypothetical protein
MESKWGRAEWALLGGATRRGMEAIDVMRQALESAISVWSVISIHWVVYVAGMT